MVANDAITNGPTDVVLLLRTSGTTSRPKIVPLTLGGILRGASSIGQGLGLGPSDRTLNVMPLTHIGGISSSLLATLLTGGTVRCTPGFDPGRFATWIASAPQPTWSCIKTGASGWEPYCRHSGTQRTRIFFDGLSKLYTVLILSIILLAIHRRRKKITVDIPSFKESRQ